MNTLKFRPQERKYAQLPRYFRWFSDHCVLRQLDESDVARIWKAVLHPAFARCWTSTIPRSEADVAALVRTAQSDWLRGTRYAMAVVRKQTHEFVGWVELSATSERGAWGMHWFIHPDFVGGPIAKELLTAAAELMFSALDVTKLYATCAQGHIRFEELLNDAGFIELVPAGSIDHTTGQPRRHALFELGMRDWLSMRPESYAPDANGPMTQPAWANSAARVELALI